MRVTKLFLIIVVLISINIPLAYSQTVQPNGAHATHSYTPRFESAECLFYEPYDAEVDCGYLTVPEDRTDPDAGTIQIHVAIFRSNNPNPLPDPIVYLEGGPGGSALEYIDYAYEFLIDPFVENRDFIVFDQRGTGYSEPNMRCPELDGAGSELLDQLLRPDEQVEPHIEAVAACRTRLTEQGINLSSYNSAENAADLNDLRQVLGYDEWNLFGISYGTRLALTAMRDTPEGIRSVVLDSTYPPQVSLYEELSDNLERALSTLFERCEQDEFCNDNYPDLENVFYKLVQNLDENPVLVPIWNWGEETDVMLNGSAMVGIMFSSLYSELAVPGLPELIYNARDGNYEDVAYYAAARTYGPGSSIGMYYSVQCTEEVPFASLDNIVVGNVDHPELLDFFNRSYHMGKAIVSVCDVWQTTNINPMENDPVISDIPTLIMAGEYDPITPPTWGQDAADYLENSFFFEYAGLGHGVSIAADCPTDMMQAFIEDPTAEPDDSCMDDMDNLYFY